MSATPTPQTEPGGRSLPPIKHEMLERRRRVLRDTAGAWSGEVGERIQRELNEMFETSEEPRHDGDHA